MAKAKRLTPQLYAVYLAVTLVVSFAFPIWILRGVVGLSVPVVAVIVGPVVVLVTLSVAAGFQRWLRTNQAVLRGVHRPPTLVAALALIIAGGAAMGLGLTGLMLIRWGEYFWSTIAIVVAVAISTKGVSQIL